MNKSFDNMLIEFEGKKIGILLNLLVILYFVYVLRFDYSIINQDMNDMVQKYILIIIDCVMII